MRSFSGPAALAAREAARGADGKFGSQSHSSPEPAVPVTLHPGALDGAAIDAYQEGQCVALAVAVAERSPGGRVAVQYVQYDWADEYRIGHAAPVVDRGGQEFAVDSYGWMPLSDWAVSRGADERDVEFLGPTDALEESDSVGMPPQNLPLARMFADAVLGHHTAPAR